MSEHHPASETAEPRPAWGLLAWRVGVLALLLPVAGLGSQDADVINIQHEDVSCLVAGQYPSIDACIEPTGDVARARVYFRAGGTPDWYYVEMAPEAECFRGTLPRPRDSVEHIDYYVSATDREFVEVRTEEYEPTVVKEKTDCDGNVAPYVGTASVVVGALSGAAVPAGFVGGGILGLGLSTAAVVGIAGAGVATGAVIAGSGGETPEPSPTPSPAPTPAPTPTPTPTPTPPPDPCADDSGPPEVVILEPAKNADVGAVVEIVAEVTDPGPVSSGIAGVTMFAEEQGGSRQVPIATFGPDAGPGYRATWTLPPCEGPQDRWYIHVRATDRCERAGGARVRVKRGGDSCATAELVDESNATVWTSELAVPEGRGQVILNGAHAVFPGAGLSELRLPVRRGHNRVEALLVSGGGEGGQWRFTLASGRLRVGRLRSVAGEVVAVGPGMVAFAVHGDPGERIVFTFEVE